MATRRGTAHPAAASLRSAQGKPPAEEAGGGFTAAAAAALENEAPAPAPAPAAAAPAPAAPAPAAPAAAPAPVVDEDGDLLAGGDAPAAKPARRTAATVEAEYQQKLADQRAAFDLEREELQRTHQTKTDESVAGLQADITALTEKLSAREAAASEAELEKLLNFEGLENSENLNPEAAKELVNKVLKPFAAKLREVTEGKAQAEIDRISKKFDGLEARQDKNSRRAVNREIMRHVPDIKTRLQDPEFKQFLQRTIPGTRTTFEKQMREGYDSADPELVVDIFATFDQGKANIEHVADVENTNTQNLVGDRTPDGGGALPTYKHSDMSNWRYQFQRKEISRQEYAAKLALFEAAEADGRVTA